MFKLWKISTAIFILQVVVGSVVYIINGDIVLAAAYAGFATLFAVYSGLLLFVVSAVRVTPVITFSTLVAFVAVLATVTALAVDFANGESNAVAFAVSVAFAILAASVTAYVVLVVNEDVFNIFEAKEPKSALFLAVLPLGIGTVFGGLLYFVKYRSSVTA